MYHPGFHLKLGGIFSKSPKIVEIHFPAALVSLTNCEGAGRYNPETTGGSQIILSVFNLLIIYLHSNIIISKLYLEIP